MILVTHDQSSEVEKPGEEAFDFPAPSIAAQRATVLGWHAAVDPVGRDHLCAVLLHELFIEPVTVVGLVPDQGFGHVGHDPRFQRGGDQFHFSRRSAFCPQGERKTMAVCNTHDLGPLAPLGLSHLSPPFLAGTNVPSTKHSLRSSPPASLSCCASFTSNSSITPERTQFWNRRCTVWYGPYRSGRSCHGAPVRKIQSTPFRTVRRSLHGRPRPSERTRSAGRMVFTIFHCSSVMSIHNYLYINH